jgi:hypothetical protein
MIQQDSASNYMLLVNTNLLTEGNIKPSRFYWTRSKAVIDKDFLENMGSVSIPDSICQTFIFLPFMEYHLLVAATCRSISANHTGMTILLINKKTENIEFASQF